MTRRDRIAAAGIAATLAISALAIGSATRPTALVAAALGLGCGAIYWRSRGALRGWPPLILLVAVGLALTALQLIPLPAFGARGELVAANAAALGETAPAFTPLSYDPAATWLELAKLIGYLGFAACAMRVAATAGGRRALAASVAGVGGLVAATTALHEIAGAAALYGVYHPRYVDSPHLLGPLLNANHLAGLLALTWPVAMAMTLESRGRWRLLWTGCAGLSVVMALLSLSRTGAVSLLVGAGALGALALPILRTQRRRRPRPLSSNRVAIGLIVATGAVIAALTIGRGAVEEIAGTEVDELTGERGKVAVWGMALDVLWANKWTGVGRGAFEHASPSSENNLTFSHVENEYLQAAVDWGLVGALLVLAAFVMTARQAAGRARGSLVEAGLAAGLLAIAVHQLADFGLELPGVALPALAALAVLARAAIAKGRSRTRRWRVVALVAGALGIAAAASPLATPARVETDALAATFADRDPREALEPALATWRRHPGDFIAAAQVAQALLSRGDPRAVAVINRALAINPAHPGLHRIAARMLYVSQRPEQALVEYRAAIARAADRPSLIRELVTAFPERAVAARGLPLARRHAGAVLEAIARLGDHELGFHYTVELVARHPDSGRFHSARAHHALQLGRPDAAVDSARIAAERGRPGAVLALARALIARGDHAEAEVILTDRRGRAVRSRRQAVAELRLLARARAAQGKHATAIESLEEAIELRGRDRVESAPLYRELATAQGAAGQPNAAAVSRARAALLERRAQ